MEWGRKALERLMAPREDFAKEECLVAAAMDGDAKRVGKALAMGASPDACEETWQGARSALSAAAVAGSAYVTRMLLLAGAKPDGARDETPPLMVAAASGDRDICLALLAAGADPDGADHDNATALFQAAINCDAALITLMVEAGADPDRAGPGGVTPREAACRDCGRIIDSAVMARRLRAEAAAISAAMALQPPRKGRARRRL